MLCPSVFPGPLTMRPLMELHWPVRSLWPETRPLFYQVEQEVLRHLQEMRQSMEAMERLHQKIFDEIDQQSAAATFKPIAFQELRPDGGGFALSLDTQEFSPEELAVKQVGRRLRVSGKTEKKQDDGKGSYTYRCQEFRQELDLPNGVDPETVSCALVGGRLQIQAPWERAERDSTERVIPISVTAAPAIASPDGSSRGPEGQSPSPAET